MSVVIFDLEGVITNNSHRVKYAQPTPDWERYNALFSLDPYNPDIKELMISLKEQQHRIYISTGKVGDTYGKQEVVGWLNQYSIPYDNILYRHGSDRRVSDLVKYDHAVSIAKFNPSIKIMMAIDDRIKNVLMYKAMGIPAMLYLNGNDY